MAHIDELTRRQVCWRGRRHARIGMPGVSPQGPVRDAGRCGEPAMAQLNADDARCEALFASALQPSDAPTADMVAEAITRTMQQLGTDGCVGQMAQEFGEHPDLAAERMHWARQLAAHAGRPQTE